MWHKIHRLKVTCQREHAIWNLSYCTEARPHVTITLHVSFFVPNLLPHNPQTVMDNTCLYKGECTHYFSQHFLHTLFQFLYWLELRSANVPARTFRPIAKTNRRRGGSSYRHTGAFFVTVSTQPFSPNKPSPFWVYLILTMRSNSLLILDYIHKI